MADPSSAHTQAERQGVERNLSAFGSEFLIADEWGVFSTKRIGDENCIKDNILSKINSATAALAANDLTGCDLLVVQGRALLNTAAASRPVWFLGNTRFGILPILFTALSSAIAYECVFVCFLGLTVAECLHHPAFLGFAGAVLKSLYWLQFQINRGLLRPRWFAYFIVAPFVGVLLGGMTALLVKATFKLFEANSINAPDWKVIGLIAAFAGFNWEWALEKIRYGAESVASRFTDKSGQTSEKNQHR